MPEPAVAPGHAADDQALDVLIVDDEEALRVWTERVMQRSGYSCHGAADAAEAAARLAARPYRLALLDVNMPGESGMDLLASIRVRYPTTAVMMVTGEDDQRLAMKAIEQGAFGYLVKPVGAGELLINVANAIHRRELERENQRLVTELREAVDERSNRLAEALQDLELSHNQVWVSQAETIFRLARLVEYRDQETGHHLQRMSSYCEILARAIGLSAHDREMVRLASQLHDVGKVAIPDSILAKPGALTPEERAVINTHAAIGHEMLSGSLSEVVQLGAVIAHTHHERWEGSGYPRGLAGEDIPLEGRIAAVADVFDALTTNRIYRPAFPAGHALEMMRSERGKHFDPEVLIALLDSLEEVEAVRRTLTG